MAALKVPAGDWWFSGFGEVVINDALWKAIEQEFIDEHTQPCTGDLALLAKVAETREAQAFTRAKRDMMKRRPGPACSRSANHAGRHVACGEAGRIIAAWPGAAEPVLLDLTQVAIADPSEVLDESRQAP